MIWSDPIVEEVRRVREAYAARFNYDLQAMFRELKQKEKGGGRKIIRLGDRTADRLPSSTGFLTVEESLAEALGISLEAARQKMEARRRELKAKS